MVWGSGKGWVVKNGLRSSGGQVGSGGTWSGERGGVRFVHGGASGRGHNVN